jgi:hypothetical protein
MGTFKDIPDDIVFNRSGLVTPDAVPAFYDGGSDIHVYPLAFRGKNVLGESYPERTGPRGTNPRSQRNLSVPIFQGILTSVRILSSVDVCGSMLVYKSQDKK